MGHWKQGLVMPQVAGTELLVARTVQWLRFNLIRIQKVTAA